MTLRQAVHEFIAALELTNAERAEASRQHTYLRNGLAKELELDADHGAFLTGSYARSTAIRPLKDIDVFCVLKRTQELNPAGHAPSKALRVVKEALDKQYPGKAAEPQNRSVNIEFSGTGIAYDVVPAFVDTSTKVEVFLIPDIAASAWIKSNPRIHMDKSVEANAAAGSELKPLTKAVKHWNRRQPDGQRLRSFHIEVMAWDALQSAPENRLSGLLTLFEGLATRVLTPTADPAGLGPDLDVDLSAYDRSAAASRFEDAASTVRRAKKLAEDGKTEAAHHLMYGLFGDPYPEKGKAESSAVSAAPAIISSSSGATDGHHSRFG